MSPVLSQKTSQLVNRFGNLASFLKEFNPSAQMELCQYEDLCYFGNFPSLASVRNEYGTNAAVSWLVPQLFDLSEYCGCKGKIEEIQMEQCASVIASTFYWLKISELMLFFHRFKSGKYGRFYGSVDPLVITTSLRDFIRERNEAYFRHEQKERERKEREQKGGISWEEYCKKNGIEGRKTIFDGITPTPKEQAKNEYKENVEDILGIAKSILTETNKDVVAAFGKVFKKKYGYTPREYIKKYENDAANVTKS